MLSLVVRKATGCAIVSPPLQSVVLLQRVVQRAPLLSYTRVFSICEAGVPKIFRTNGRGTASGLDGKQATAKVVELPVAATENGGNA